MIPLRDRSAFIWEGLDGYYVGRPYPYWAMTLAAYFDDSREMWDPTHTGGDYNRLSAIAGYVAPIDAWQRIFEPEWRTMLEDAPHPLTEFKTADARHLRQRNEITA